MGSKGVLRGIPLKGSVFYEKENAKLFAETLKNVTQGMAEDYRKTVKKWKKKPKFKTSKPRVAGGSYESEVSTDNTIYGYIDRGTDPYTIVPKKASRLRFQPGYYRATVPGVLTSFKSGRFGKFVYAKKVNHPGIRARKFTEIIQARWQTELEKRLTAGIKRIVDQ